MCRRLQSNTYFSLLLLCMFGQLGASGQSHASTQDLLQKGLAAYQNKQYSEAHDAFQKIMDQGLVSPGLLHDLALSAYQLDQKPLALALWRKALTLRPTFRPAQAGRDFLEGKMQVRPLERDSLSLWTHRNLELFSFYDVLWISALMMGIAGWLWLRYWGERRSALEEERPLPAFPSVAIFVALVLLASVYLTALKIKDGLNGRATVIGTKVSARILPASDGVGLFDLSGGAEVWVRQRANGWAQVQNSEGTSGWVKDNEILITSER